MPHNRINADMYTMNLFMLLFYRVYVLWQFYLACDQFRNIERLESPLVLAGIPLRKEERFAWLSVLSKVSDVQMCESSVHSAAAENYPSAIGRPGMIALSEVRSIPYRDVYILTCIQVNHLQVGFVVPDREGSVISQCI